MFGDACNHSKWLEGRISELEEDLERLKSVAKWVVTEYLDESGTNYYALESALHTLRKTLERMNGE